MKTNMKLTVLLAGLVVVTQAPYARADASMPNSNAKPSDSTKTASAQVVPLTPQQFVDDATAGNLKEVYLSEMAMDRCTNDAVRNFAEHMIRDHRAANDKLAAIAKDEGLTCLSSNLFRPDDPAWNNPALAPEPVVRGEAAALLIATNVPYYSDYRSVQLIKPLKDSQFRDAYITAMNDDHMAAVSEFEIASQTLTDQKLKKYAEKTLPTLRRHLEMAQRLKSVEFESASTNILSRAQTPQPYNYYPGMP